MSGIEAIRDAAESVLQTQVTEMRPVAGGELNDAYALGLSDGRSLFLKTSPQAHAGSFVAEAAGLHWIADAVGGPLVPEVQAVIDSGDSRMLILSWVRTGPLSSEGAERLGRELAALHRAGAPAHGAPPPPPPLVTTPVTTPVTPPVTTPSGHADDRAMFVGPIRLPTNSDPAVSWAEVYANLRVRPVARLAEDRGALPAGAMRTLELLCERLPALGGPAEPPSRLHGDLWGGNVIADTSGVPYLIDPAAYGGHREVDLAMLRLFGGPGERCFAAYEEAHPLSEGHAERIALWQLFPVLLHAALFGGGYGGQAVQIARRYL